MALASSGWYCTDNDRIYPAGSTYYYYNLGDFRTYYKLSSSATSSRVVSFQARVYVKWEGSTYKAYKESLYAKINTTVSTTVGYAFFRLSATSLNLSSKTINLTSLTTDYAEVGSASRSVSFGGKTDSFQDVYFPPVSIYYYNISTSSSTGVTSANTSIGYGYFKIPYGKSTFKITYKAGDGASGSVNLGEVEANYGETLALLGGSWSKPGTTPTTEARLNYSGYSSLNQSQTLSTTGTYTFTGYNIGSVGSRVTIYSDIEAIAQYSYSEEAYPTATFTIQPAPRKDYYNFDSWSGYLPGSTIILNAGETKTLSANWTPYSFNIVFQQADGWSNIPSGGTISYEGSYTISSTPIKNGCKFKKWNDTSNYNLEYVTGNVIKGTDIAPKLKNNNTTLTLKLSYDTLQNKIILIPDPGKLEAPALSERTYNVDMSTITLDQPTPPEGDYVFIGWNGGPICGKTYKNTTNITFNPSEETNWGENGREITLTANYVQLGKYVKVNGKWSPIVETYVKQDGAWRQIESATDTSVGLGKVQVKVNDRWVKEVGS